eukprot:6177972-Pleurochrysis_carterae.AAC.1
MRRSAASMELLPITRANLLGAAAQEQPCRVLRDGFLTTTKVRAYCAQAQTRARTLVFFRALLQ